MKKVTVTLAMVIGLATSADAGPIAQQNVYSPATVGTTDQIIVNQNVALTYLDIINVSNTATVCISFGLNNPATIVGTQCAAGEIPFPPGWHRSWEGSLVPSNTVHAISSAASTQLTVGVK